MATASHDCTVNYHGQTIKLKAGQELRGGLARYLAATGGPIDDPDGEYQPPDQDDDADDGQFDPSAHTVDEVNAHLEEAWDAGEAGGDVDEVERVLAAEADGKARKTVADPRDADNES